MAQDAYKNQWVTEDFGGALSWKVKTGGAGVHGDVPSTPGSPLKQPMTGQTESGRPERYDNKSPLSGGCITAMAAIQNSVVHGKQE